VRVLFWGTPEFAVPSLRALVGEGFDVVAVVTQPDRAVGRSRSRTQPPTVKLIAEAEGIAVLQPERPRGDEFLSQLRSLAPDVSVVVAYGHILPREVIDVPRLGTLNLHGSLLPAFRGAAPIQAAIRAGHSETGVTVMRVVPALDAGPVLLRLGTPIFEDETGGELALRLSEMGAQALIEALALVELGAAPEEPQDDALATYAPKIQRGMTRVNWKNSAAAVSRSIRAYDPSPGAFSLIDGHEVKLFGAREAPTAFRGEPGEVVAVEPEGMIITCGDGAVRVTGVHPAGKSRMLPVDWHRGRGVAVGARFDVALPAV
jgi:methionyl-tRNA formyltransferase